jgi:hypothetical protein
LNAAESNHGQTSEHGSIWSRLELSLLCHV